MRTTALAVLFSAFAAALPAGQVAPPPVQQPPPPAKAVAPPAAPAAARTPPVASGGRVEILEQILVKVNGEIISKTELENRQVAALRQRAQQMSDEELKKAIAAITPEVLVDAVDELLLLQRGKELGYKVTDEQFKRVLENIRKENKLESDEQFNAALKQEGISIEQLRKNLEKQMVINQVQQVEVAGKVGISESEAQAYYDEHKNEFTTAASLTLRELLVAVKSDGKSVNVAADEAAKTKAEGLLARARAGEPFAALVAEASDAPSKASGGVVGPLSAEELDPGVRKLIEGLKPGSVTEVFRTGGGYALLQVDALTPPVVKAFDTARDDIAQKVYESKRNAEFGRYLAKLRSQAIIEWKNEEMHKLWMARTAPAAPPTKNPGL
ncbi:MAG: peptidyl-prolyl cis-trans isomerase [Vicinamibacterales bacterium]|jgi:peptidyl-prolyl cis-trans isomerase SurA|nr:peptidyl-prolyl cis-trans isomerase [Vicinamibacterales bacterium]